VLEAIREDYVRTAAAKGLNARIVLVRHTLRPSLVLIVTLFGLQIGAVIGGSVPMRTVTDPPRLGCLAADGVLTFAFALGTAATGVACRGRSGGCRSRCWGGAFVGAAAGNAGRGQRHAGPGRLEHPATPNRTPGRCPVAVQLSYRLRSFFRPHRARAVQEFEHRMIRASTGTRLQQTPRAAQH